MKLILDISGENFVEYRVLGSMVIMLLFIDWIETEREASTSKIMGTTGLDSQDTTPHKRFG